METIETRTEIIMPSPSKLFTPAVTTFLILMVIGCILAWHLNAFTSNNLAVTGESVIKGKIWQVITYSFVDPFVWNLIFNMIIVLFMGSSIEREWGTKSFLMLWFVTGISCALIWIFFSLATGRIDVGSGAYSCVFGIIATFGLLYRHTRMWFYFFTLEAQYIAMILIAVGVILCIPQPIALIWVIGALIGYLYVKLRWRMAAPRGGSFKPNTSNKGKSTVSKGFIDID